MWDKYVLDVCGTSFQRKRLKMTKTRALVDLKHFEGKGETFLRAAYVFFFFPFNYETERTRLNAIGSREH